MKDNRLKGVSICLIAGIGSPVYALNLEDAEKEILTPMVIEGDMLRSDFVGIKPDMGGVNDAAALLTRVPGANVNSNGPLSGIAQYRGLFGDRVNVVSDGATYKSACANAMDAPLSHVPTSLTETMSIKRGIASVSSGIETLGGSIVQQSRRGEFAEEDENVKFSGKTTNGLNSVNDGYYTSLFANIANQNHKFRAGGSREEGDNYDWDGGLNKDTSHERNAVTFGYGFRTDDEDHEFDMGYNFNDTHTTGTPSLPMDIIYSRGGVTAVNYKGLFADKYAVNTEFTYQDIKHRMDNYTLRGDIPAAKRRQSNNTARGFGYKMSVDIPLYDGNLLIGTDGDNIEHDAKISNPFNAAFSINNFNDVERDRYGIFAEWKGGLAEDWEMELGTRVNWVRMDAKDVGGTAGPFASGKAGVKLANEFNSKKHRKDDLNVDVVAALTHHLNSEIDIELGFGRKTRSPSYQERYLWLPLNATGGLADGRNYIGNIELQPEVSYQAELGVNWQLDSVYFMPRVFYRYVEDYIQGVAATNAAALKVSPTTLQYSNVDAYLYGVDLEAGFRFHEDWKVEVMMSYVRGRRDDVSDNLYRIAPLNGRIGVFYDTEKWLVGTELLGYDDQNKTSSYNDEEATPGYFIWNFRGQYRPQFSAVKGLQIGFGIENMLDESYRTHLSGTNRNPANDGTAIGEHLPGVGRNFYATLSYDW